VPQIGLTVAPGAWPRTPFPGLASARKAVTALS